MMAENGYITLEFTLSKNAVVLFEVSKVVDESDTYIGLDDSKIPGY